MGAGAYGIISEKHIQLASLVRAVRLYMRVLSVKTFEITAKMASELFETPSFKALNSLTIEDWHRRGKTPVLIREWT